MGARPGGQAIAISLAVPLLPPPVLSPTRQSEGRPARRRLPPVLQASSQPMSRSRDADDKASPIEKPLHVAQHGGGRGGVARIARCRLVELGLDAVEPRRPVAQDARIGGQGRWAAEAREQQVARRVVAQRHRRLADFRHRHAAGFDMILGDRRISDEILGREDDTAIEPLVAAIDARQHQGRGEELEGAGHREALIAAPAGPAAARRVERRHPQATANSALKVGKHCTGVIGQSRQRQQRTGKYRAARNRSRNGFLRRGARLRTPRIWRGVGTTRSPAAIETAVGSTTRAPMR